MRKIFTILIITATGLFSCRQSSKKTANIVDRETVELPKYAESQKQLPNSNKKYIDTQYIYSNSIGKRLIVQNSLPKGTLKYTDTDGREFVCSIFWTHISNETEDTLKLNINFSADSIQLPSSADNYFKIALPSDTMTTVKEPLFNYGIKDLEAYLDSSLNKSSSLQITLNPNDSCMFYVVTLFNHSVQGPVRAGLSLKKQDFIYTVNDKEIHSGNIGF